MKGTKTSVVARRWAKAFFSLARDEGQVVLWGTELARVVDAAHRVPHLVTALADRDVDRARRARAVDELAKVLALSAATTRLLKLMIGKDRIHLFLEVTAAYGELQLALERVAQAALTVADKRRAADLAPQIQAMLCRFLGREVRCDVDVEPKLGAGFVVRLGDTVFDGSFTGRLQRMKEELLRG